MLHTISDAGALEVSGASGIDASSSSTGCRERGAMVVGDFCWLVGVVLFVRLFVEGEPEVWTGGGPLA